MAPPFFESCKGENMDEYDYLEVLIAIVAALDAPRNRFGKLEPMLGQADKLRHLSMKYCPEKGGGIDAIDQAVNVCRAIIATHSRGIENGF